MTRKPILFCCTQSTGLMNSSLSVAGELARRGVPDLWFATDENRRVEVEKLAARSEVGFVSLGDVDPALAATMWDEPTYRAVTGRSRFVAYRARVRAGMDAGYVADKYSRLSEAVARIKPALMVINSLCHHAFLVAITHRIPFVITAPFLPSDLCQANLPKGFPVPQSGMPRDMTRAQRFAHWLFRLRMRTLVLDPVILRKAVAYGKAMDRLGVDRAARPQNAPFDAAEMILCFSLLELDYPFPVPDKLHMLGTMVPPLPETSGDDDLTRWLDAQESVVYVAFGTITRLTRDEVAAMVEVARRLGDRHQVLWKLPREQQAFLPPAGELPANLRIESWLPSQYDVLAHRNVKVFFNHAGSNSFHEGLYFGKPLLSRPLWLDCYDHAVRAVDSGAGLTVDRPDTVDPDDVHHKLRRLLEEDSFRERAGYFSELQRRTGGVRAAADLILGSRALS
ncbi:glycosyltransferase [Amycolatopsis suaedae]|uniref:Glycosyltransferase n=1 Tax=Amycolatopsis suaedae TaxID=2510978 RepID=A0A4Q7J064_9PSEU|nr:glycosyltransferase [Amycolatopsis suaedae]RZQ60179.1 glycosyltransferase [Amycolatopsis suaedae]